MMALTKKGMDRQEAHELLRRLTIESEGEKRPFRKVLLESEIVRKKLSEKEIDYALKPRNYLGTAKEQVTRMVKKTTRERKARGMA